MREEKKYISAEYRTRLNASPFVILVEYRGMTVGQFTELRKRLVKAGSQLHVVKNSIFRIAAKEAGVADLTGSITGQMAAVTGQKDISSTAKILKTFVSEFDKPKLRLGFLGSNRLEAADLVALADLPPIEVLRSRILGLLQAPAGQLVRMINAPGSQLARVIQARVDKGE